MNDDTIDPGSALEISAADARIRGVLYRAAREPAPALVLVPDVHGVSPLYRELAAGFAAAGFHTLVLDIYSREGAPLLSDFAAVQSWLAELPDERVLGDVSAAIHHLGQRSDVLPGATGIVGFCVGGQYALMSACRHGGLAACVAFYGMLRHGRRTDRKLPAPLETAGDLGCPLLGLFGADDPLIPAADVEDLRSTLTRCGRSFELHVFAGAGHAFMNDRRPESYRPTAAAEAFDLAVDFLHRTLA